MTNTPTTKTMKAMHQCYVPGVAVGNGLTEPRTQTLTLAAAAWAAGVVTSAGRNALAALALEVVALIDARKWEQSHLKREVGAGWAGV